MFKQLLTTLGLQPKNLMDAGEKQSAAKAFAESVNALFTNAGLNLEQMLEAGPESLKAHMALLSAKDGELAAAQEKINALQAAAAEAGETIAALEEGAEAAQSLFEQIGFVSPESGEPEAIKAAFKEHVAKAATLELAKTGHPPVAHVPQDAPAKTDAAAQDEEHLKAYESLAGKTEERRAYFDLHSQAILRAHIARGRA